MGHLDQSLRAVARVSASFDQLVAQWESLARRKEQHRQNLSMLQIRKMHAEHTGVRTRVQLVKAQIRRLRGGLDQLEKMTGSQAVEAESPRPTVPERAVKSVEVSPPQAVHGPRQLPPGFLEAFQAAGDSQGKSEVVQQYFEIEAKLEVEIRSEDGQDRALFAPFPVPPINRFYFLLATAQIIRTRRAKIADVIHVHYPDTGKSGRMSLKEFVTHVRNGVWLLRPKSKT
jgi:septum formation topological specificity factor MinE